VTIRDPQTAKTSDGEVAELQGLYGPFQFGELLLQKLWLRGEFDQRRAATESGEPVRIVHPGSWNRLSGPDFRGARLVIGDREVRGDVELHFRAEAWQQHGHHNDPAFNDVVLHVVLFPPGTSPVNAATTSAGVVLPVLSLVSLLWHDLEEYAADAALAALSGVDTVPLVEELLALPADERDILLNTGTRKRWEQKVHFSKMRIEKLGWDEACHQTALEILGYRANRAPMLRVAGQHPFSSWSAKSPDADALYSTGEGWWSQRGVRPSNHPRARVAQYVEWMRLAPDWPQRLRGWKWPDLAGTSDGAAVGPLRRQAGLPAVKRAISKEICAGMLGGSRLDTWVCNLALPFAAACRNGNGSGLFGLWRGWYPGDAPELLLDASKRLRADGLRERDSNGLIQGLLAQQFERARR
jgi:hypothetical protein